MLGPRPRPSRRRKIRSEERRENSNITDTDFTLDQSGEDAQQVKGHAIEKLIQAREEISRLQAELDLRATELKATTERATELNFTKGELDAERDELKRALQIQNEKMIALELKLDDNADRVDILRAELAEVKETAKKETDELEDVLRFRAMELDEARNMIDQSRSEDSDILEAAT